jgi:hypothetical protein
MRKNFAIAFAFLLVVAPATWPSSSEDLLKLRDVRRRYSSYEQIKPTVLNQGAISLFLDPYSPGVAGVEHFDESASEWYQWGGLGECGAGPHPTAEMKPGDERRVLINWGLSIIQLKPPPGRYRLRLKYSPELWTSDHRPKKILTLESREFHIVE